MHGLLLLAAIGCSSGSGGVDPVPPPPDPDPLPLTVGDTWSGEYVDNEGETGDIDLVITSLEPGEVRITTRRVVPLVVEPWLLTQPTQTIIRGVRMVDVATAIGPDLTLQFSHGFDRVKITTPILQGWLGR